jgi:hypothetical protein
MLPMLWSVPTAGAAGPSPDCSWTLTSFSGPHGTGKELGTASDQSPPTRDHPLPVDATGSIKFTGSTGTEPITFGEWEAKPWGWPGWVRDSWKGSQTNQTRSLEPYLTLAGVKWPAGVVRVTVTADGKSETWKRVVCPATGYVRFVGTRWWQSPWTGLAVGLAALGITLGFLTMPKAATSIEVHDARPPTSNVRAEIRETPRPINVLIQVDPHPREPQTTVEEVRT